MRSGVKEGESMTIIYENKKFEHLFNLMDRLQVIWELPDTVGKFTFAIADREYLFTLRQTRSYIKALGEWWGHSKIEVRELLHNYPVDILNQIFQPKSYHKIKNQKLLREIEDLTNENQFLCDLYEELLNEATKNGIELNEEGCLTVELLNEESEDEKDDN